jgi:hypothetical protein
MHMSSMGQRKPIVDRIKVNLPLERDALHP